jgi:double-GTPase-like protein
VERIMVNARRTLVIGLHASGKTTFIAALWHVAESDEVPSSLRVHTLDGDRTYLDTLRAAWLRCETIGRTSQQAEKHDVRMLLEHRSTKKVTELWLPDMSGESFRDYWVNRQWPKSFDELVQEAAGALVFVHPSAIVDPLRIETVRGLACAWAPPEASPAQPSQQDAPGTPWDAGKAPTQVQLVELLQFVQGRRPPGLLKVGVVVSAWDTLRGLKISPREWSRKCLPLLTQFLEFNPERISAKYFGVSAQGGKLPEDAERLRTFAHASERIDVVDDDGGLSHDITLPIREIAVD